MGKNLGVAVALWGVPSWLGWVFSDIWFLFNPLFKGIFFNLSLV
jgi:hypothetical protein